MAKNKIDKDYKKFNLSIERARESEIEKIRQEINALKAKAHTIT